MRTTYAAQGLRLALFSLAVAAPFGAAQAADWESFGPEPIKGGDTGRIMSIAAHPTDADTIYVGAASGGVWKREGDKFIPVTNKLPANSIGALAIDPKDPKTIYAGSGEPTYATHAFYGAGLYKSTDAGKTWKVLGKDAFAGRTFGRILIHPKDSKLLFAAVLNAGTPKNHPLAGGDVGVKVSKDAGKTWETVKGLPDTVCSDLEFAPDDPNTIYAAMSSYDQKAGLHKSTDGGKTWKPMGSNLPKTGKFRIAVTKADPKKIWVVSSGGNVYRSDNSGESFSRVSVSGYRVQGWYDIDINADPKDANSAYVAGVNLFRTTNNGSSWNRITPPHVDLQILDFDASGNLLCGGDGGIHRSQNKGSRWDVIGKGISNIQIYAGMSTHPTNKNFFIGGLQDNGTVMRNGESLAWNSVLGGDGGTTLVNPDSPEIVFAQIQMTASLYKSTNGGRSFKKAASGISSGDRVAFYAPIALDPKDPNIVYYPAQRLYKSTNGGQSYKAISADVTGGRGAMRSFAVSPEDSNYMYAGTTDNRVVVSTDGGKNFKVSLKDSPGYPRVARAISVAPWGGGKVAFKGVGAFGTDQVIMTEDAGGSWKGIDGDLPDVPVNSVAAFQLGGEGENGSTKLVLAGSDRGVYLNCDLDGHWRKVGKLLPNVPVHDIRYDKYHKRIVAGTFGRGAWAHPEADAAFFEKLCMQTENPDDDEDDVESEDGETAGESEGGGESGKGSGDGSGKGGDSSGDGGDGKGKGSEKGDGPKKSGDKSGAESKDSKQGSGGAEPGEDEKGGCNCTAPASPKRGLAGFGLILAGLGLVRRNRKSRA